MAQTVTAAQAAKILGVSRATIHRRIADGRLKVSRKQGIKRTIYIDLGDLQSLAAELGYKYDPERAAKYAN